MIDPEGEMLKLNNGESWSWDQGDCNLAEIWRINNYYFLFEGKLLSEYPCFVNAYLLNEIHFLIKKVKSWT